jgi:uncharacterized protein (TIGR02646 family)
MIKIDKDIEDIPESLIPAIADMFRDGRIAKMAKTTHARRKELIDNESYIDHVNYNSRYKTNDITDKLKNIYKSKCAFCEQKVEQLHVEHFRPKVKYYWLAYSWDNLILACPKCNEYKGINFEINGDEAIFDNNDETIKNINSLSEVYNHLEQPKMVNPEVLDPKNYITFTRNGEMSSTYDNFIYTIDTCKLNREYLNDGRRKILDDFRNEIRSELVNSRDEEEQRCVIRALVSRFIHSSKDISNEYIAFRNYSIVNNWLNEIVREIRG